MKKLALCSLVGFAVALIMGIFPGPVAAGPFLQPPNGWHFTLNLIGMAKPKSLVCDSGSRIFVKLSGNTKILLTEGPFQVLDCNGTDGEAAFQLPANPCVDGSGNIIDCPINAPAFQCYSVWARALGKPCNPSNSACEAIMKLCGTQTCDAGACSGTGASCVVNSDCNECSTENVVLTRNTGRSNWQNVTKQLTTICVDVDNNGSCDIRIPLFDDDWEDFFWSYDNNGLRLAQLRFYPEPGDVCGVKP